MPHKMEFVELQGKARWVNTRVPDQFGKWGLILYPNAESLDLIKRMQEGWYEGVEGIKNVLKKDEDGYHMRFTRPQSKQMRGKVVGFSPPELLKSDGETPLRETLVGNGSDVTVKLELYFFNTPSKREGSACRVMSIRVDSLIPFEAQRDFTDDQKKLVAGMNEVPPPQF